MLNKCYTWKNDKNEFQGRLRLKEWKSMGVQNWTIQITQETKIAYILFVLNKYDDTDMEILNKESKEQLCFQH